MSNRRPAPAPTAEIRCFDRREAPPPTGSGEKWVEHQVVTGKLVLCRYRSAAQAVAFLDGWRTALPWSNAHPLFPFGGMERRL